VWFGIFHHDNASAHTALSVREFLASKQIIVLEHPPYSLDLASSDFGSVSKNKVNIESKAFDDIDDIRSNTMAALKAISQNHFQNCSEGLSRRWYWGIASQGEHFEGDHSEIHEYYCQNTYNSYSGFPQDSVFILETSVTIKVYVLQFIDVLH
jgi:hypothetical protein